MPTAIQPVSRTAVNVSDHVRRHARTRPHAEALRFGARTWSYAALDAEAARAANALLAWGTRPGDRIAIHLPNVPEFVSAYLGALRIGAIVVSVPTSWRPEAAARALADTQPVVLVTTAVLQQGLAGMNDAADVPVLVVRAEESAVAGMSWESAISRARDTAPSHRALSHDAAAILYSSGTTSTPKGVVLSHRNVATNARLKAEYCGLRAGDRVALVVPLSHCYGQNAVMNAAFHAGACVVLAERFDVEASVAAIGAGDVNVLFGVPPMFARLLDADPDAGALRRLRYVLSAATTLPQQLAESWEGATGLPIHEAYGLTESAPFAAYSQTYAGHDRSLGAPIRGVEMAILDPSTSEPLRAGEWGEIAIRGHNVMLGYWNRPEETARALRGGWLHTGDIGYADDRGQFHLLDRADDLVKVSGFRVYPATVEAALRSHPFVEDCAAYGVMDQLLGERVEAAVVLRRGWAGNPDELRAHCAARLASYEVPSRLHACRALPRSATGKVIRGALRAAPAHPAGLQRALEVPVLSLT